MGRVDVDGRHHVGGGLVRPGDVVGDEGHREVAVVAQRVGELAQGVRALRGGALDQTHLVDTGYVAVDVLDAAERLVAAHPEFELLSVRRGLRRSDD
ncbi:DUF503 domain-containing protein [Mycobacterium sp. E1386]|uniref:DUF503 domain-containing protein n=1 Tax=Mycobacterium sp. E1386 TaxID=1834126 RepID=UPI003512DB5D